MQSLCCDGVVPCITGALASFTSPEFTSYLRLPALDPAQPEVSRMRLALEDTLRSLWVFCYSRWNEELLCLAVFTR